MVIEVFHYLARIRNTIDMIRKAVAKYIHTPTESGSKNENRPRSALRVLNNKMSMPRTINALVKSIADRRKCVIVKSVIAISACYWESTQLDI